MGTWILNRAIDLLIALLVMVVILWYVLTQPSLTTVFKDPPAAELLPLDRQALEVNLREVLALTTGNPDADQQRVNNYLATQLASIGAVERFDRIEGQTVFRLRVGQGGGEQKLFVALHYVVTEKPILELAESLISLLEVARSVKEEELELQLNLSIFVHPLDKLEESLSDVSLYHVDQLEQAQTMNSTVLVMMPALRLPEAAYVSSQWRYFALLLPSTNNEVALYGRLANSSQLHDLKAALRRDGLIDLASMSVPVTFGDAKPSALKAYWGKNIAAFLLRPNILVNDKDYQGHIRFISALHQLLKTGY